MNIRQKLFNHVGNDRPDNYYQEIIPDLSTLPEEPGNCFINKNTVFGFAALAGIVALIKKFFERKNNKYKASPDEIKSIQSELPQEYGALREIQCEVIKSCRFIFSSRDSLYFYCNILPSLLNLNGEEWIAGWARETGKTGPRWAPILSMYNSSLVFCYDFDKKYWFIIFKGKEYTPNDNDIWKIIAEEFNRARRIIEERMKDEYPDIYRQSVSYVEINQKLIKKFTTTKFKLKRKTFGIPGALFGAKNWGAMRSGVKTLADGSKKNLSLLQRGAEGAKGLAKSAATVGTGAVAVGAPIAYTAGGGDFISGGERSAKNMEFS